ncbi:YtcA family lipoprotein [[Enterobacter] lignolyticus]|uniref:YtcA family lipoprotein n=1 Tax=[Enterobacter] lignolyticus TaxID=1334193 RepID=UPI00098342B0|nr:YtcA family lipoprotein [[Enterobacter] lignolyticus]
MQTSKVSKRLASGKRLGPLAALLSLTGCAPAPSIVLFGAAFPDWLLCTGAGVAGMILLHVVSVRRKKTQWLQPAAVVYPCVTALIAMLTWLLVFPH